MYHTDGSNEEKWLVTVEVLIIPAKWLAICQLERKHKRQRQLREHIVKCVSTCDVIIKLDSLQSGLKPPPEVDCDESGSNLVCYLCVCHVNATNVHPIQIRGTV